MAEVTRFLVRRGPDMALIGVSITVVASLVTALLYTGADGEPYQAVNHTVSELGERGASELALVFNLGLIAGGLLIAGFMAGQALVADDRAGRGFWITGTLAGMAMAAVGVVSVDMLEPHIAVAAVAFGLLLVVSAWFAVWVLRYGAAYQRGLAWFAAWIAVAMVAFVLLPALLQPEIGFETGFTATNPRPEVLLSSLLEWIVVASAWAWVAALAWHHREMNLKETP